MAEGGIFRPERAAIVEAAMLGEASSSCNNPVVLDVSAGSLTDTMQFPVLKTLPLFEAGRVGTSHVINMDHVLLLSGKARSMFSPTIPFVGKKLQSIMDFVVDADAQITPRFQFRDAEAKVART